MNIRNSKGPTIDAWGTPLKTSNAVFTCMHFEKTGAMSPNFGDGHSLKRYVPELLAGVIFDVYDQHTQIITELRGLVICELRSGETVICELGR